MPAGFRIHLIAGARPNFMKVAPLYHALQGDEAKAAGLMPVLVHTGQHYSPEMSDFIFRDLRLPEPDHRLGVGGGTLTEQTSRIMAAYEKVLVSDRPNLVVVVGDVNSTLACALVAKQLQLPVAHLEAGLRSRDWTMPEELNRVVTDRIADHLWTPSPDADANLLAEGARQGQITCVGNIMIDSFEMLRSRIEAEPLRLEGARFDAREGEYAVVTLHRPSNVDSEGRLRLLSSQLVELSQQLPVLFPVHPRTRAALERHGLLGALEGCRQIHLVPPQSYVSFMRLVVSARMVLTDSGGIQEETTYLGIPCLTVRESTERPITVDQGTNRLIRGEKVVEEASRSLAEGRPSRPRIDLWDGRTAERVVKRILEIR